MNDKYFIGLIGILIFYLQGKIVEFVYIVRVFKCWVVVWKFFIMFMVWEFFNGFFVEYQVKVVIFLGDCKVFIFIFCRLSFIDIYLY